MPMRKREKLRITEKMKISAAIKTALDNLPTGICFIDRNGVPVLVNHTMHKLAYALTGQDIQDISDFDGILKDPAEVFAGDGTVWQFRRRTIDEEGALTEVTAVDITELYLRKTELEEGNAEKRDMMQRLETISKSVVSITRSEEILAMKMRIHSDLGYALSETRHFITSKRRGEEKEQYIKRQREMAGRLLGEIGNSDEPALFDELKQSAERLGMEIVCEGEIPRQAEELLTKAVRECLVNTIRHADGDRVYVKISRESGRCRADITNNGKPPAGAITEGGGLSALRRSIEESGGVMTVEGSPGFLLKILFPEE